MQHLFKILIEFGYFIDSVVSFICFVFFFFIVGFFRLYYTKVQLGSPPREFHVQIDTGSDVLWVSCSSCNGCPGTSGLQVNFAFPYL